MEAAVLVSDEELMQHFQAGSEEAFSHLFQRYSGRVYGFFRRRLVEAARAEEMTQDTFLALVNGASRYAPRALLRTYIYGIALNLLAAERRKRGREMHLAKELPEAGLDPRSDTTLWVRAAIARLDPDDREVVLLREYEQLSYAEMAELLQIPVNTVRSRLFRARMALRDLLVPRSDPHTKGRER